MRLQPFVLEGGSCKLSGESNMFFFPVDLFVGSPFVVEINYLFDVFMNSWTKAQEEERDKREIRTR